MAAQKVKGLSTYCEIKDVSITQQEAIIKILMFSNQENNVTFGLKFFLLDEETKREELINNNTYWVERFQPSFETNGNVENNIDINLFKELYFKIDITDKNRSIFLTDRWIRNVRLIIKASTIIIAEELKPTNCDSYSDCIFQVTKVVKKEENEPSETLYTSELLNLVSGLVVVPDIKQISIKSINSDLDVNIEELVVSIYYDYGIENDFNYNNENIQYFFRLINPKTLRVIKESQKILTENGLFDQDLKLGVLKYTFTSLKIRTPIIVNISIRDLKGNVIKAYNKFYIPSVPKNKVYVKFNGVIKEVDVIFTNYKEDTIVNIDKLYVNNGTVDYKPLDE
jgi:hypothetical protein